MQGESQTETGMLREKIIRHWVILLFLFLGVLFLAIGTMFFMQIKGHSWYEIIYIIAFEAAIIFFTATIIETLLLKEFGNRAVETMERIGKDTFALLRNAEYNGIIDILPPRFDASKNQKGEVKGRLFSSQLRETLEKSKKVKIFCTSGGSFLWRSAEVESGVYDIFSRRASNDPKVQMLLASPTGYGAEIRGKRESPEQTNRIVEDIEKSKTESKRLQLVVIKYYNFIPHVWFVITDDKMFFEPYHMADHTFLKNRYKAQFTDKDLWCGGRVPIFVVKKDSTLYDAMENYFDWLWEHNDPVFDEFREYFNVEEDVATEEEQKSEQKI